VPRRAEDVASREDRVLSREVEAILKQHMTERPFLTDVIVRLRNVIDELMCDSGSDGRDDEV
jgi:hypothetical protein